MVEEKLIVLIKLHGRNIKLPGFNNETLTIEGHTLQKCLKFKITEEYKGAKKPLSGYAWLSKIHGIVKWIRVPGRTEVRDLKLVR